MDQPPPVQEHPREIWSWAFYDFANSAYATSVISVIFNVYFVQVVLGPEGLQIGQLVIPGASVWAYLVSLTMLGVLFLAPVLGAIADYQGSKKRFLFLFCYLGVLFTGLLALVGPGDVWAAMFLFALSNLAMESSLPFYNAFLPELTSRERFGKISGWGWGFGYAGSVLSLLLNLALMRNPEWFGIPEDNHLPVRMTMLVVALWWGLFSIPTFLWVRERAIARPLSGLRSYVRVGFQRLWDTLRNLGRYRELTKFLLAFLIYNDGIQTVLFMAAIFGAEVLKIPNDELILCLLLNQVVALGGSFLFSHFSDRLTNKTAIQLTLVIWTGVTLFALWMEHSWHFWVLSVVAGLVLGASQSASRALFAEFTPAHKSAEFFSFFGISGKLSSVLGPVLFAVVLQWSGSSRWAVASICLFFLMGLLLLAFVREEQGIAEGRQGL